MADLSVIQCMINKLNTRVTLDADDCAAIYDLPLIIRNYETPAYVLREGDRTNGECSFVSNGLAIRQKLTAAGGRQIVSIHMRGDFLDTQHLFLNRADHSIQALTRLTVAEIQHEALQKVILDRPNVARAFWIDVLIDASIYREWIVNVGRRDARTRIAHLLCEFSIRMRYAGLSGADAYTLPMTQEQIADAVGLTPVHVNRTLRLLVDEGLIERDKRHIRFLDWEALCHAGDFSALYLHLDQADPAPRGD